jgi:hypothetical protein
MVEPVDETQYYAIIGRGNAPSDASGLARRIKDGDETVDQSLRRDLSWGPTNAIAVWDYGEDLTQDLKKISKQEADELIERFREKWSQEG